MSWLGERSKKKTAPRRWAVSNQNGVLGWCADCAAQGKAAAVAALIGRVVYFQLSWAGGAWLDGAFVPDVARPVRRNRRDGAFEAFSPALTTKTPVLLGEP